MSQTFTQLSKYKISFSHQFTPYIQSTKKFSQLYYHLSSSSHAYPRSFLKGNSELEIRQYAEPMN